MLRFLEPSFEIAKIVFETTSRSRKHLTPWMEWATEKGLQKAEQTFAFLQGCKNGYEKGTQVDYGIFLGKKHIGNVGLFDINEKYKSAEKGGWLCPEEQGNGYMTEAISLLLKEAFEEVGLNRIQSRIDEKNTKSQAAIKRQGFTYEGTGRQTAFIESENRWENLMTFSILKNEWMKKNK